MKSYYVQQTLSLFLIALMLVGSTVITNLNTFHEELKEASKLSSEEVLF